MRLAIKTLKGDLFHIEAELTDTVLNLKEKIQQDKSDFVVDKQKLIHAGKVLKDTQSIGELGIKDTDFIVCMVSKEPAAKPVPKAPTPAPIPTSSPVKAPAPVASPVQTAVSVAPVPAPIQVNPEALQALVGMGFPESESRSALTAAMGNPDLAYEFLLTGIPEQAIHAANARQRAPVSAPVSVPSGSAPGPLDQLRLHPQFNALKQLIQQNPAALPQVLSLIGDQNPQLLEAIHANNDAFVAMMNEPISSAPSAPTTNTSIPNLGSGGGPSPSEISSLLSSLPPEQRAQFAQSVGMSPEQLQQFMQIMATIPPEQLSQMLPGLGGAPGGGSIPPGANVIRLSDEELQAVNRLQQLGFSQDQALQAYLACDKNEAVAANLLFDGGLGFDDDEGGGYGGGDYGDDDM
mmetsp:Transcript_9948/g.8893  ORF Transcript_9948/g.8893 Transcript_9948/m.8893 type:complete len:406 (-) Transcript_9948:64-1281(-)